MGSGAIPGGGFIGDERGEAGRVPDFGQDGGEDAAIDHQGDGGDRIVDRQRLDRLVGDAFARQGHQVVGAGGAGLDRRRVGLALTEAGVEAEETKDAQMIFGDALEGSPMKRTRRALISSRPPK